MAYIPKTDDERRGIRALVMDGMRLALVKGHKPHWEGIYEEADRLVPPVPDPIAMRVRQTLAELVDTDHDLNDHYLEQLALACAADLKALMHQDDDEA